MPRQGVNDFWMGPDFFWDFIFLNRDFCFFLVVVDDSWRREIASWKWLRFRCGLKDLRRLYAECIVQLLVCFEWLGSLVGAILSLFCRCVVFWGVVCTCNLLSLRCLRVVSLFCDFVLVGQSFSNEICGVCSLDEVIVTQDDWGLVVSRLSLNTNMSQEHRKSNTKHGSNRSQRSKVTT